MVRFLILLAALFGLAFGFHWLKGTAGEVALTLGGTVYAVDLTTATIALIALVLVLLGLIWFLQEILRAPGRFRYGWRRRSVERGRAAVSQGLIALAAGDLRTAERANLEASRRSADLPLARLLQAQTAQLKGDRPAARLAFQAMTEDPQTRIAGLRGLHMEAEREGEHEAAHRIALIAREESPSTPWAARALLGHQLAADDWDGALKTLSAAADGRVIDKRTARRQRAVILTAKALAGEAGDPDAARHAATEAHELAPGLAPAAVIAGRLLARQGDIRRATRVLETAWKASPHPDLADAYAHVRAGDSATDRLKRTEALHRMRPQADEGRLAVARAAIDARDFARAREVLTPVLTTRPTRNALIVMGEIEEAETGDRGRAREWLARAVRAPRDPAWTADGIVLEAWAPVSPVTGRIDAVEWKAPVVELQGPALDIDARELERPAHADEPAAPAIAAPEDTAPEAVIVPAEEPSPVPPAGLPPFFRPAPPPAAAAVGAPAAVFPAAILASANPAPAHAPPRPVADDVAPPAEPLPAPVSRTAADNREPLAIDPPNPDNPGVPDDEPDETPARRFRVF